MIYSNGAQVFRGDISGVVEQAKDWEQTLIGLKVMPAVSVPTKAGQYPVFNLAAGNLLRNDVQNRAPSGTFARGTRSFDSDTFQCLEFGYEEAVDDVIAQDMSRYFNAEVMSAKLALRKILIAHEVRVAAQIMNTQFTATAVATNWTGTNVASFDAGLDFQNAIDRLLAKGVSSNGLKIVMSYPVWTLVRASTKFQNRLRGAGISSDTILNASLQAAAEVFGVDEVCIGRAAYDASIEGQAFSSSNIWSNTYAWVGKVTSGGSPESMLGGGAGFTLNWSEYGPLTQVFSYRDEPIKSNIIRASQHTVEKVVDTSAAELLTLSYSAS
jgi:hypothetical protein